jgi:hypothetical protein
MRRKRIVFALALVSIVLAAAACGSSKKSKTSTTDTTTTPANANRKLSLPPGAQPASATKKPTPATLKALPLPRRAGVRPTPALKGLEGKSGPDKLAIFAGDAGAFWQKLFSAANVQFAPATVNIIASQQTTPCRTVSSTDGPVYCTGDNSISLGVDYYQKRFDDPEFGDAGVLTLVGYMWALHVENVLGLFKQKTTPAAQIQTALCLDGVYVASVGKRGLLDSGDIDKIARAAGAGGDAPGTPADQKIGTTDELIKAFAAGADSGNPGTCVSGR